MKFSFFAASMLFLFALECCVQAQQGEPGTGSTQVSSASAAPRTQAQPSLRTDSPPRTEVNPPSTDSGPDPETLGVDATPVVDLGWDWSLPQGDDQTSVLKRIVTNKRGTSVIDVQTLPVAPLPVTNPPDPPSRILAAIPEPHVTRKPPPPDPLARQPQ